MFIRNKSVIPRVQIIPPSLKYKLYSFSFFDEFILIYPLYAIMFQDKGLTSAQISSLFMALSIVIFVLEVPSGSVADRFPRKKVLVSALLMRALAFSCWLFFPSYYGFLFGFILWGFKRAFASGTMEAFVYDELKRLDATRAYTRLMGTMQTYNMAGFILGGLCASILARAGYPVILLLSIAAVLASAFAVWLLPSAPKVRSTEEVKYLEHLRGGTRLAAKQATLRSVVLFGAVVSGLRVVDEYYSLFLNELHFSNRAVALWVAAIYVFGAFGSAVAHRLEHKNLSATHGLIAWAVLLGVATICPPMLAPVFIGLFAALFYTMQILANARLQHLIDGKSRATVTSLMGFGSQLMALVVFGVFSVVGGHGYRSGLQVIAGVIVLAAIASVTFLKRKSM